MLRFVINLNRSKDRWENIQQQFKKFDLDIQRIEAIDAKESILPQDKVAPLGHSAKYFFPRELTTTETACHLSHRKCWETFLKSDKNWAAILEDDVLLSPRAKAFLESEDWIPSDIHILQLHTFDKYSHCKTTRKKIPLADGSILYNVITTSFGACCYIIDRQAAEKALTLSSLLAAPVDEFLFNFKSPFTQQFPTMRINPCCALHNSSSPSTIGQDRFSRKKTYSLRNLLSPRRLYLSAEKNILSRFFCADTVFTWK